MIEFNIFGLEVHVYTWINLNLTSWMFPSVSYNHISLLLRMCYLVFPPLLVQLSSMQRIRKHPLVIFHFTYYIMHDILC